MAYVIVTFLYTTELIIFQATERIRDKATLPKGKKGKVGKGKPPHGVPTLPLPDPAPEDAPTLPLSPKRSTPPQSGSPDAAPASMEVSPAEKKKKRRQARLKVKLPATAKKVLTPGAPRKTGLQVR